MSWLDLPHDIIRIILEKSLYQTCWFNAYQLTHHLNSKGKEVVRLLIDSKDVHLEPEDTLVELRNLRNIVNGLDKVSVIHFHCNIEWSIKDTCFTYYELCPTSVFDVLEHENIKIGSLVMCYDTNWFNR